MGKNPAFLFYPMDWQRDLEEHPLEIEGAWIRICCKLWWSETRGEMTKSLSQWARILREKNKKTEKILQYLSKNGVATITYLDNQNVTIISRRMVKDEKIRQIRREVGKLGGNPNLKKLEIPLDNQSSNQNGGSSVSVSVSVSDFISSKEEPFEIPTEEQIEIPTKDEIENQSVTKLKQSIENLSKALYDEGIFTEIHAFKNRLIKSKANLRAIVHTLTRCYTKKPDDPWAYCISIMKVEDANFNERDYAKAAG